MEFFTAMLLFFTIPVISAAAERSFSKYLRNNIGRIRFRHLPLIAIENKTASSLNLNELIVFRKLNLKKNCKYNCYLVS